MQLEIGIIIAIGTNAFAVVASIGAGLWRLKQLEERMKCLESAIVLKNGLQDRTARIEEKVTSIEQRCTERGIELNALRSKG